MVGTLFRKEVTESPILSASSVGPVVYWKDAGFSRHAVRIRIPSGSQCSIRLDGQGRPPLKRKIIGSSPIWSARAQGRKRSLSESGDRACLKSMRTRFDSERLHRGEGRPSFPGEFHTLAQARCNTSPRNQIEPRCVWSPIYHTMAFSPRVLQEGFFLGVAQPVRARASGARDSGSNPDTLTE